VCAVVASLLFRSNGVAYSRDTLGRFDPRDVVMIRNSDVPCPMSHVP
jgi:hypothetical protein